MKKHTNIVMDPITHLLQVDKIVDDISKEIVHRPRHSPHKDQWVESNNVAVMEGFGKRTISLSKSTRDLNLTNENEELEVINDHSDWKIKSRAIKRRSRGWMNRLQEDLARGRVQSPSNNEGSSLLTRASSMRVLHMASKFSEAERQKRPVKPRIEAISDLKPFSDDLLKSSLCVVCFDIVCINYERVNCAHCPVVAHSFCVKSKPELFSEGGDEGNSGDGGNACGGGEANRIASQQEWTCPFCIHEAAILLLQSHIRMFPIKKQYRLLVSAAITVQRFHRSQHLRRALIKDRLNQRRPLRLCIHQVTLLCEPTSFKDKPLVPVRDIVSDNVGGTSGTRVFCQFSTNHLSRNIANKLADTVPVAAIRKLPSENLTLKATNTELRRSAMLNLLQLGHMMEPQSSTPSAAELKSFPPHSLFLTLTVQRFEHGTDRQLYRDDVPLYPLSDPAMHTKRGEYMGHFKVLEAVSEIIEGGAEKPAPGMVALKIFPPRSMVLLPSCPADVTVYLTVSRVTEWPRACIIGQALLKTDHLSIWRQCVCMSQVINIHNIEEEPKNDSSSNRLVLFYRPMTARSALPPTSSLLTARGLGSGRSQLTARSQSCGLPDIGSGQNTGRGANPNKIPNYISKNVVGGQILWSFISTPPVGNMFGHLHFLTHGSLLSYKKKSWCVVIDGQLLIYARATDLKPKEVVLLKLCHFNVEEKVIMTITRTKDSQTWYCMCDFVNKRSMWIDAFKENTLPSTTKHVLKKGTIATSSSPSDKSNTSS